MASQCFLCVACGTQYAASENPPLRCPICDDERQYVPAAGQRWATVGDLRRDFRNEIRKVDDRLHAIYTRPHFAIGQRAYLIQSPGGNVLCDCVAFVDADTVAAVWALGGISAIAVSHPHYYTTMVEWSNLFGGIPIYVHADDAEWVQRPAQTIEFWTGDSHQLHDGITLVRCGGHFEGASVVHWEQGADGNGILIPGDVIQVCPDQRWVSFMYSYPNYIPLSVSKVQKVVAAVEPYRFSRVFGAFGNVIEKDGRMAVVRSAARYIQAVVGGPVAPQL